MANLDQRIIYVGPESSTHYGVLLAAGIIPNEDGWRENETISKESFAFGWVGANTEFSRANGDVAYHIGTKREVGWYARWDERSPKADASTHLTLDNWWKENYDAEED